jgi:cytochrome d ubiquinol oxidase subunit II
MIGMLTDLTVIWTCLLAFAVFAYVALDGFDLGIGMLFGLFPARRDRDVMMNSVAPVWDGNETWLILGGGGLFAAFPLAYALIMPALYIPLIAMLLALVFRGVAFEFRWRDGPMRHVWDAGFILGSLVATLAQGAALGALLQGIAVDEAARQFAGDAWDWLTPFSMLTAVALVVGYSLLGATWLVFKTEGKMNRRARRMGWWFALGTIALIGIVSLATPFLQDGYYNRWFVGLGILLAIGVGAAVLATGYALLRSLTDTSRDWPPFLLSLALFGLCFAGLGICMWPYVVPIEVTVFEAAAPAASQEFMLVGASVLIPVILAYTAYAYWVFRGKVRPGEGYH